MMKNVADLSLEELEQLAGEAWSNAANEALAKGLPITGSQGGRRFCYHPGGRIEDLGPVETPEPASDGLGSRSVA